jgi:hypothetical protein
VAAKGETLEAEVLHHLELIQGHSAFGVLGVPFAALGLGGVTVSAQVGGDYREVFGEARGDEVPHRKRLGTAVEQQDRRSFISTNGIDLTPFASARTFSKPSNILESSPEFATAYHRNGAVSAGATEPCLQLKRVARGCASSTR